MIYYFSGTGNSKWVAEQLALKTDDTAVNMMECSVAPSINKQTIGIVFPVYAWGPPEPVIEFIKKLEGKAEFTYGVCTCGADAGKTMDKLCNILPLSSKYSIVMPSNYIMGADVESDEIITSKIIKAKERLNSIAVQVLAKQSVNDVNKGSLSWIKSNLANYGFNRFARNTKQFYVKDNCTACGLCANNCPSNTIRLINGKPQWGKKCYQCTACINCCPVKAIEYGKATSTRGRYQFKEK